MFPSYFPSFIVTVCILFVVLFILPRTETTNITVSQENETDNNEYENARDRERKCC